MGTNETKLFKELSQVEKELLHEIDTVFADAEAKIDAYLEELKAKNNE